MRRFQLRISREPVKLLFLAGFAYCMAAAQVFAAHFTNSKGWSFEWGFLLAAIALGWFLSLRGIWLSISTGRHTFLVCSLSIYWLLALLGLLFMALSADPMPFLSTLVSALISVMVAWLVANILKEHHKESKRGWWTSRR